MSEFLIVLRETLEAAIIVGLIFSMMHIFHTPKKFKLYVWGGVLWGILLSWLLGFFIENFLHWLDEFSEKIYSGTLTIIASAMITHFIIWTHLHFKNLGTKIKHWIDTALQSWELYLLSWLAFISVMREWLETAIFLNALHISLTDASFLFAVLGFCLAICISYGVFFIFTSIKLHTVIQWTNILFLFLAAGLLVNGLSEFESAGIIPYTPFVNFSTILSHEEGIGSFLHAIIGYNSEPSLVSILLYISYIMGVWYLMFFSAKKKAS